MRISGRSPMIFFGASYRADSETAPSEALNTLIFLASPRFCQGGAGHILEQLSLCRPIFSREKRTNRSGEASFLQLSESQCILAHTLKAALVDWST